MACSLFRTNDWSKADLSRQRLSEILIKIHFLYNKMHLQMSCSKDTVLFYSEILMQENEAMRGTGLMGLTLHQFTVANQTWCGDHWLPEHQRLAQINQVWRLRDVGSIPNIRPQNLHTDTLSNHDIAIGIHYNSVESWDNLPCPKPVKIVSVL